MDITPTKQSTNERVTGPGNGMIPLVAVIVLTALTWGGIWMMNQRWYHDPLNPVGGPAAAHGAGAPAGH
jgi:hypothetical protein